MSTSIFNVIDATWPAAVFHSHDPWIVREGQGGGKRVSAASALRSVTEDDIAIAEAAQRDLGQAQLFLIRPGDEDLDQQLEARGYDVIDPVTIFECPVDALTTTPIPRVKAFAIWEPLAIMTEIWDAGGIGAERRAVMNRVSCPKTGLFGRSNDKPAGAGFVAVHESTAMVHALEIGAAYRRQGLGTWMMRVAAFWASEHGASRMTVMCTRQNEPACRLYASLGMTPVGKYHYRLKTKG